MASFAADDSYGSSSASTAVAVSQTLAATTTETISPLTSNPPYEMYTIGTGIAVIIAIAIVGFLIIRKRQ